METHAEPSELQTRTMRRVVARLMPVLLGLYFIAYLDRVNVAFAREKLESDLGFSGAVSASAPASSSSATSSSRCPSNLALHRFGARKWIARIMVTWGIISACTMFVQGPLSFYVVRFLLGVAEAGFFPGMILYLRTGSRPVSGRAPSASSCRRSRSPTRSARRSRAASWRSSTVSPASRTGSGCS